MPQRNVFSKNLEIPKISQPDSLANQNGLYLQGVYFYFINLLFTSGLITELFSTTFNHGKYNRHWNRRFAPWKFILDIWLNFSRNVIT